MFDSFMVPVMVRHVYMFLDKREDEKSFYCKNGMGDEHERDCGLRGIMEINFDPNAFRKIEPGDSITLKDIDRDMNGSLDDMVVRFLNCADVQCNFNDFFLDVSDPLYINNYPEFLRLMVQNLRGKIASVAGGVAYKVKVEDTYKLKVRHEQLKSAYFNLELNVEMNNLTASVKKALTYYSYFKDNKTDQDFKWYDEVSGRPLNAQFFTLGAVEEQQFSFVTSDAARNVISYGMVPDVRSNLEFYQVPTEISLNIPGQTLQIPITDSDAGEKQTITIADVVNSHNFSDKFYHARVSPFFLDHVQFLKTDDVNALDLGFCCFSGPVTQTFQYNDKKIYSCLNSEGRAEK